MPESSLKLYLTNSIVLNPLPDTLAKTVPLFQRKLNPISVSKNPVLTAVLSTTAAWLSFINVPFIKFVSIVLTLITDTAGPAANAPASSEVHAALSANGGGLPRGFHENTPQQ